ncbi:MAG: hypothetical protein M3Y77_04490, partial [Actinomycetota bacterium]|nr:hypothetical protein [Actinomycetota bacterium]
IRREKRDALIAAGIGVDPDDDSVFGAAEQAQLQGYDTPAIDESTEASDGSIPVPSFIGATGASSGGYLAGDETIARTLTDPQTKETAAEDRGDSLGGQTEGVAPTEDRDRF